MNSPQAVGNSGALAGGPGGLGGRTAGPAGGDGASDLALIEEAWKAIQDNYVDAQHLDDRDLAYGAIRGMTEAVGDEGHTSFMTADEAKAVDQYGGLSRMVNRNDDTVTAVFVGGRAVFLDGKPTAVVGAERTGRFLRAAHRAPALSATERTLAHAG